MMKHGHFSDNQLVDKSLSGDAIALEEIITRYKDIVFNFTLRMIGDYYEAQDISQEVLIKVITNLSTFQKKSSLKTWILRITSNHVISQKRKIKEFIFSDFSSHNELLDGLGNETPVDVHNPENKVIGNEMMLQCIEGMLLCLDRDQRAVFIIGAIMGISSSEGAEVLNISNDAFRKRLSRARKDLSQYIKNRCGLINPDNPCRCKQKAKAAFQAGYISENRGVFNKKRIDEVSHFINKPENLADALFNKVSDLYKQVPVMELESAKIKQVVQSIEFKNFIGFS